MLNLDKKIRVIQLFRNLCLLKYPQDIDAASRNDRDERFGSFAPEDLTELLRWGMRDQPLYLIALLLKTPRLLKMVLRNVWSSWLTLHGEIDFDDLLVSKALNYAAPQAYDFLLECAIDIRNLELVSAQAERDKKREQLKAKWDEVTKGVQWNSYAAEKLIAFLFPMWETRSLGRSFWVLQGIKRHSPTDYWLRLNIGDIVDEIRDQDVLHAIKTWKADRNSFSFRELQLPEAICKFPEITPALEHFGNIMFDGEDVRIIAHELFELILTNEGIKANADSSPAFIALWRLAISKPVDEKKHSEWISSEICHALPVSLRFVNDLYYYWKYNDRISVDMKKASPEVRNAMISEAKKLFKSPEVLLSILDPVFPYSIYHFAVLYSKPKQGGSEFNPEEWKWLANILLGAALLNTEIALPQLISWIFNRDDSEYDEKYIFNEEWANILFGNRLPEVMELIAYGIDDKLLNQKGQNIIIFAQNTAKKWIADNIP